MDKGISIGEGALWVLAWFGVMLLYTFLDVAVWRKIAPRHAKLLNVISIAFCTGVFLSLLKSKFNSQIGLVNGNSLEGILLAIGCAAVMYFLLDKCLDPVFEGIVLGLLYIRTNSLIYCIAAHAGYNMISYFTMVFCKVTDY